MTERAKVDERVEHFTEMCRSHGVRVTHQRTEILRELAGRVDHPDAETVYRSVRRRIPSISLDTIYRTLRLFEEKGIVARMGATSDRARFDANTEKHHHFVCVDCGLVRDFYSDSFNQLPAPSDVEEFGHVDTVYVELRGLCRQCRGQREKTGK